MPKHIWSKIMGDAWTNLGCKCVLGITHNFFGKLGIGLMPGYVISVRKNLSFYLFGGISLSRSSLGSYVMGQIPLWFYIPMERFFDGTDQENSKTQGGNNGGKKKKKFWHMWRFPYLCVLHRSGMPSCYCHTDPLLWEPRILHYTPKILQSVAAQNPGKKYKEMPKEFSYL